MRQTHTHTQSERDAMTVEIVFALVTAAVFAGAAYLAVMLGLFAADVHDQPVARMLAAGTAATVFIARVLQVLLPSREPGPEEDETFGPPQM